MSRGEPPPPSTTAAARPGDGARLYRRDTATRAVAVAAAALFINGSIASLILTGAGVGFALLALAALMSLANLVTAWGDRLIVDAGGIEQRNLLLIRLGARPRRLPWSDIGAVREHRGPIAGRRSGAPRALILMPRAGKWMILDSVEHFDEIIRAVTERVPVDQ